MNAVNPKVTYAAGGAVLGGGSMAIIIIWCLTNLYGMNPDKFTPDFVVALTSVCSGISAFVSGWLKKHGIDVPPMELSNKP